MASDCCIDAVACRICLNSSSVSKDVGVLYIYLLPSCTVNDNNTMINIISTFLRYELTNNVIVEDFSFGDINWPDDAHFSQSNAFLHFCQDNFLSQYIHSPTRRASNAILDLVLAPPETLVSDVVVGEEFGSSDHSILQFSVRVKSFNQPNKKIRIRNLSRADWSLFQTILASLPDLSEALISMDIDYAWNTFVLSLLILPLI